MGIPEKERREEMIRVHFSIFPRIKGHDFPD